MEEILYQLRLVGYPIIYRVLYIPLVQDFFHQQYEINDFTSFSFTQFGCENHRFTAIVCPPNPPGPTGKI